MNILYIDANIYLRFYNSNSPEYKKLLASIIELRDKIFFTEQIGNEVDRNKLNVFRRSIENYIKQVSLTTTSLPEHLDEDGSPKLTVWNKARKELEVSISKSNTELKPILNEVFVDISISKDKVSKALKVLYKKTKKPSLEELKRGRLRKEIGNPPGKRADPLGDQLSWEQLLTIVPKTSHLWIVSTDRDYFTEHHNDLYLNPILHNDLKRLNEKIEIKIFNQLSKALKDFNNQEKITSIPSKEELEKISILEAEMIPFSATSSTHSYYPSDVFGYIKPMTCPKCSHVDSFLDGAFLRSQYGGLTFQYVCKDCGFRYDTGNFFE